MAEFWQVKNFEKSKLINASLDLKLSFEAVLLLSYKLLQMDYKIDSELLKGWLFQLLQKFMCVKPQ